MDMSVVIKARDALRKASETFRKYAEIHASKANNLTGEDQVLSREKMRSNLDLAIEMCGAADDIDWSIRDYHE